MWCSRQLLLKLTESLDIACQLWISSRESRRIAAATPDGRFKANCDCAVADMDDP